MRSLLRAVLVVTLLAFFALPGVALADTWVAVKLRGAVVQLIDGDWVEMRRGDAVPDDRVIRTLKTGKVTFKRGKETIDLAPQTQIQIVDKTGKQFTTVKQHFGTVSVEAEVRNVQHFEVLTPHLAAVVKGTKFIVSSGKSGGSVKVTRGRVAVEDQHNGQSVTVVAGQLVEAGIGKDMDVSGRGKLPAVVDSKGNPVVETASAGKGRSNSGNGNSAGNAVTNAGNATGNAVGDTVSGVGGAVGGAVGGSVGETVSNTTQSVGNTVSSTVSGVTGIVGGLL